MRRLIAGLSGLLLMGPGLLFSQYLPSGHYKYIVTQEVLFTLANAAGTLKDPPALAMYQQDRAPAKWRGAGFERTPVPRIYLEERLYDACAALGPDSLNALACILGHELAHFLQNHSHATSFATAAPEDRMSQEAEADYDGTFYGVLAGYETPAVLAEVLETVYRTYQLPEQLAGYPSKTERFRRVNENLGKLRHLSDVFRAGQFLFLSQHYAAAEACFDYLGQAFPSREMLHNEGTAQLAQALSLLEEADRYYAYPIELEVSTRLRNLNTRGVEGNEALRQQQLSALLTRARENFERAVSLDENYVPAYINLALTHLFQGDANACLGRINDLERRLTGSKRSLPGNAYLVRAFAFDKLGQIADARREMDRASEKQAFQIAYNRDVFQQKTSVWSQMKTYVAQTVNSWISAWWKSSSSCPPGEDRRLSELSMAEVAPLALEAGQKIPQQPIKIATLQRNQCRGLSIHFAAGGEDRILSVLSAQRAYSGRTSKGIGVGSSLAQVLEAYCEPDAVFSTTGAVEFYRYAQSNLLLEIRRGKVSGWHLWRLSY